VTGDPLGLEYDLSDVSGSREVELGPLHSIDWGVGWSRIG
jgi:hypothetical protein